MNPYNQNPRIYWRLLPHAHRRSPIHDEWVVFWLTLIVVSLPGLPGIVYFLPVLWYLWRCRNHADH